MSLSRHQDEQDIALVELLDRALDKGVVLWGDITLSVANVDLVYVGLKVLLSSVETVERMRKAAADVPERLPVSDVPELNSGTSSGFNSGTSRR